MWHLPTELETHFNKVRAKRASGPGADFDDDEEPSFMMQNEYAQGRGRFAE